MPTSPSRRRGSPGRTWLVSYFHLTTLYHTWLERANRSRPGPEPRAWKHKAARVKYKRDHARNRSSRARRARTGPATNAGWKRTAHSSARIAGMTKAPRRQGPEARKPKRPRGANPRGLGGDAGTGRDVPCYRTLLLALALRLLRRDRGLLRVVRGENGRDRGQAPHGDVRDSRRVVALHAQTASGRVQER